MPYSHYTEELLDLKDIIVSKVERKENIMHVYLKMEQRIHTCPDCGSKTSKIHDYRNQRVKDISSFGQYTILHLKKRRHVCPECGKKFFESVPFLPRYHRITNRLFAHIIREFSQTRSMKNIALCNNISAATAARAFDLVCYSPAALPEVLAIDEFRGNSGGEKFQGILTDPKNHKVVDILPTRSKEYLFGYFSKFSNRKEVKFFVMDMYSTYKAVAKVMFPNATIIIDKYHYVRIVTWAFERVRIEEQKKFSDHRRKYFKNSRKLLLKNSYNLNDQEYWQVKQMLRVSPKLARAYEIKQAFEEFMKCEDSLNAKKKLADFIMFAQNYDVPEFESATKTFINWSHEILNSFDYPYTNGYTEGCNNKIKVIKRVAYGMSNFPRFRSRILHSMAN
jgi:transposase